MRTILAIGVILLLGLGLSVATASAGFNDNKEPGSVLTGLGAPLK